MQNYGMRIFQYSRNDNSDKEHFKCLVILNMYSGSVCFNEIVVPTNTPENVKRAFLEEAEKAVFSILDKEETTIYGGG